MSKTTIDLEKSVRDELKRWKERHGHKSLSAAVAALVRGDPDDGEGDDGSGGAGPMDGESDVDEGEERIPQLFSYRLLARDAKALKYHTGLRKGAQDWLMGTLRSAV